MEGLEGMGEGRHTPLPSLRCLSLTQPTSQRPRKPDEVSTMTSHLQHKGREGGEGIWTHMEGPACFWPFVWELQPLRLLPRTAAKAAPKPRFTGLNPAHPGLGTCPSPAPGTSGPGHSDPSSALGPSLLTLGPFSKSGQRKQTALSDPRQSCIWTQDLFSNQPSVSKSLIRLISPATHLPKTLLPVPGIPGQIEFLPPPPPQVLITD